jgi:hypothetical protein
MMMERIMSLSLPILLSCAALAVLEGRVICVPKDHATIQAAIDAAEDGDEIIVARGTYKEKIHLKANIVVRSAGGDEKGELGFVRAEKTVILGTGDGVKGEGPVAGVTMAEGSTFDGFTVTGFGKYDDEKWQEHWETRGDKQAHEHIGRFGAPGIGADGVKCSILNNIVHHIGHTGIAVGGVEGSEVASIVKGNFCYRNMGGGIGVMRKSKAVITGNTCFENFYAGVGHNDSSPLVEKNRCYGNIRAGIGISEGACPTVRENICYGNRRAGIGTRTGKETAPIIEENHCYENGMAGIGVDEGAAPIIRKNICERNTLAGIGARGNAIPKIVENICRDNKASGIGFEECDKGSATVTGNQLINNALVAIGVQRGWAVEISDNTLSREGGLPPMIMVFEGADCTIKNNTFQVSGVAGVRVAGTARVIGNQFDGGAVRKGGPPHFGVWALAGSTVTVRGNHFKSLRHGLHASEAVVSAVGNVTEDFSRVAIVIQKPSKSPGLRDNIAITSESGAVAVQVDGKNFEENGNLVKPAK